MSYGHMQITIKPYKNEKMNNLERLSLYATMAMLYCALFFLSDLPKVAKVRGSGGRAWRGVRWMGRGKLGIRPAQPLPGSRA